MTRTLVVYCSRSGMTADVARRVAAQCGADVEAIEDSEGFFGRAGPLGYVRCALEALLGVVPSIRRTKHLPAGYDLVVVGTPIWCWNMASPVRAYLIHHRADIRRVAFFSTMGGSGAEKVLADLERLCGKAPLATLALTAHQVEAHLDRRALAKFVIALRNARPSVRMAAPVLAS